MKCAKTKLSQETINQIREILLPLNSSERQAYLQKCRMELQLAEELSRSIPFDFVFRAQIEAE